MELLVPLQWALVPLRAVARRLGLARARRDQPRVRRILRHLAGSVGASGLDLSGRQAQGGRRYSQDRRRGAFNAKASGPPAALLRARSVDSGGDRSTKEKAEVGAADSRERHEAAMTAHSVGDGKPVSAGRRSSSKT